MLLYNKESQKNKPKNKTYHIQYYMLAFVKCHDYQLLLI